MKWFEKMNSVSIIKYCILESIENMVEHGRKKDGVLKILIIILLFVDKKFTFA